MPGRSDLQDGTGEKGVIKETHFWYYIMHRKSISSVLFLRRSSVV
jgi:hypothetical protein